MEQNGRPQDARSGGVAGLLSAALHSEGDGEVVYHMQGGTPLEVGTFQLSLASLSLDQLNQDLPEARW